MPSDNTWEKMTHLCIGMKDRGPGSSGQCLDGEILRRYNTTFREMNDQIYQELVGHVMLSFFPCHPKWSRGTRY
jgi:hypothetical protein